MQLHSSRVLSVEGIFSKLNARIDGLKSEHCEYANDQGEGTSSTPHPPVAMNGNNLSDYAEIIYMIAIFYLVAHYQRQLVLSTQQALLSLG
jgi:hypothetical protein